MKYELMQQIHGDVNESLGKLNCCRNSLPGLIQGMQEGTSHDEIADSLNCAIQELHKVIMLLDGMSFGYLNTEVN